LFSESTASSSSLRLRMRGLGVILAGAGH
jgi:hypothetical protein